MGLLDNITAIIIYSIKLDLIGFYGDSIDIFIGSNGIYWVI